MTSARPARPPRLSAGNFFFGHGLEYRRGMLAFFQRCAREGDLVEARFPNARVNILSAPEHVEHVLLKNVRNYPKDPFQRRALAILGNGLLLSDGDFWLRQRRMMQPVFHRERLATYGQRMVAATQEWNARHRDGEDVDLSAEMMGLTLTVVAGSLFGTDVSAQTEAVGHAMEDFMVYAKSIFESVFVPPLWVPTPRNRRYQAAVKTIYRLVDEVVAKRRAQGGGGDDLLGLLLEVQAEDGARMTDTQVRDETLTLMMAGHETTAVALGFCLLLLARHPEVEAELRQELATVLGGRAATVEDLPNLPFTECVVKETLRLYPSVWGMSRSVTADDVIGGFHVGQGTLVAWSQWAMHRNPRFFPEPESFQPRRWADGLEKRLPRFAYLPFGGGPRLCIGVGFAMMEARLLLATLLQHWRFEPRSQEWPEMLPSITLRPLHGLPVTLRKA